MPRQKIPARGTIRSVGSLISDSGTLMMDAELADGRRVFISFEAGKYAQETYGKKGSEARRMRALAETLILCAERLERS
jgi:hypothetical protein